MGRGAPSSQQSPEHHTVLWQRAGGRGRGQERLNPGPARTQLARAAAAGEEFGKCFLPHLGNHGCLWLYGKSQSRGAVGIIFKLILLPRDSLPPLSLVWPFSSATDGDSEGRGRGPPILVTEGS